MLLLGCIQHHLSEEAQIGGCGFVRSRREILEKLHLVCRNLQVSLNEEPFIFLEEPDSVRGLVIPLDVTPIIPSFKERIKYQKILRPGPSIKMIIYS